MLHHVLDIRRKLEKEEWGKHTVDFLTMDFPTRGSIPKRLWGTEQKKLLFQDYPNPSRSHNECNISALISLCCIQ